MNSVISSQLSRELNTFSHLKEKIVIQTAQNKIASLKPSVFGARTKTIRTRGVNTNTNANKETTWKVVFSNLISTNERIRLC